MSKMADLIYDVQEMYIEGMSAKTIARTLECPVETVLEILESFGVADEPQEDTFDPFNTVNS